MRFTHRTHIGQKTTKKNPTQMILRISRHCEILGIIIILLLFIHYKTQRRHWPFTFSFHCSVIIIGTMRSGNTVVAGFRSTYYRCVPRDFGVPHSVCRYETDRYCILYNYNIIIPWMGKYYNSTHYIIINMDIIGNLCPNLSKEFVFRTYLTKVYLFNKSLSYD